MKRRIILVILILVACIALAACDSSETSDEKIEAEPSISELGPYKYFETTSEYGYVEFLNELDPDKYEIVNITILPQTHFHYITYIVTYKEIG